MKNHNDFIGNRTRDLPDCGTVPQLTLKSRGIYDSIGNADPTFTDVNLP